MCDLPLTEGSGTFNDEIDARRCLDWSEGGAKLHLMPGWFKKLETHFLTFKYRCWLQIITGHNLKLLLLFKQWHQHGMLFTVCFFFLLLWLIDWLLWLWMHVLTSVRWEPAQQTLSLCLHRCRSRHENVSSCAAKLGFLKALQGNASIQEGLNRQLRKFLWTSIWQWLLKVNDWCHLSHNWSDLTGSRLVHVTGGFDIVWPN